MGVVKHWRILFSPTILLLYDVTRGSPDDEFEELTKLVAVNTGLARLHRLRYGWDRERSKNDGTDPYTVLGKIRVPKEPFMCIMSTMENRLPLKYPCRVQYNSM